MIEIKNLTIQVPGRTLVSKLNYEMRAGERWCILGKNGSGKSTLLRTIAGLQSIEQIGSGQVLWEKQDINNIAQIDLAKLRAYAQQVPVASDDWHVRDVVKAGAWPWIISSEVEKKAFAIRLEEVVNQSLDRCDISHLADQPWKFLSGGERARTALAACLTQTTKALLLDEPTAHLDLGHQFKLIDDLVDASKCCDQLLVASIHDLQLVSRGFTHALILNGDEDGTWIAGELEDVLTPRNIENALKHPVAWLNHEGKKVLIAL